jgi:periplasmic divalent cation tolerance protein
MSDFIEIRWTAGSLDEARKVARYLVQERYVACAKIVPWVESIYMWNNQLETTQESTIVMQTRADLFEKVKEIILQNSRYQVPEITFVPLSGGSEGFFGWLKDSVSISKT